MKDLLNKNKWNYRVLLSIVAILIVVFAGFEIYKHTQTNTTKSAASSQYVVLNARVVWTSDYIRVINLDDSSWSDCQLILNQDQTPGGYTLYRDRILPKEVLQIAHHLFVNAKGAEFDIKKQSPASFLIRCENVNGKVGLFSGKYSSAN
jgi:hypothetical protein